MKDVNKLSMTPHSKKLYLLSILKKLTLSEYQKKLFYHPECERVDGRHRSTHLQILSDSYYLWSNFIDTLIAIDKNDFQVVSNKNNSISDFPESLKNWFNSISLSTLPTLPTLPKISNLFSRKDSESYNDKSYDSIDSVNLGENVYDNEKLYYDTGSRDSNYTNCIATGKKFLQTSIRKLFSYESGNTISESSTILEV